jgi:hypothetical protein
MFPLSSAGSHPPPPTHDITFNFYNFALIAKLTAFSLFNIIMMVQFKFSVLLFFLAAAAAVVPVIALPVERSVC